MNRKPDSAGFQASRQAHTPAGIRAPKCGVVVLSFMLPIEIQVDYKSRTLLMGVLSDSPLSSKIVHFENQRVALLTAELAREIGQVNRLFSSKLLKKEIQS
ncbi:MAG: hypothetical protein ABR906_07160 [Terracidiphilus sp.]